MTPLTTLVWAFHMLLSGTPPAYDHQRYAFLVAQYSEENGSLQEYRLLEKDLDRQSCERHVEDLLVKFDQKGEGWVLGKDIVHDRLIGQYLRFRCISDQEQKDEAMQAWLNAPLFNDLAPASGLKN